MLISSVRQARGLISMQENTPTGTDHQCCSGSRRLSGSSQPLSPCSHTHSRKNQGTGLSAIQTTKCTDKIPAAVSQTLPTVPGRGCPGNCCLSRPSGRPWPAPFKVVPRSQHRALLSGDLRPRQPFPTESVSTAESSSSSSFYSQPIRPSALENSSRSQTDGNG